MLSISLSMADQSFETGKSIGIFNVSRGLVEHLARRAEVDRLTVFLNRSLRGLVDLPPPVDVQYHDDAVSSRFSRVVWDQWGVHRAAEKTGNQWLVLAKGFSSFLSRCPVNLAVIVYDVMPDHYRRTHPAALSKLELWYFSRCLFAVFRQARILFTISEFTAAEVKHVAAKYKLRCPEVVTMGIGFERPVKQVGARENRVLALVSPFPHKCTDLTVRYLERWQRQVGFEGQIDCVGRLPAGVALPRDSRWRLHGRLPDVEYRRLLAKARSVVFMSEYEGFGMPPVEAVMAGVCPVYSDIPATREVMQGSACSFMNHDYESFASAMNNALLVPDAELTAWGNQLHERHNWGTVCAKFLEGLIAASPDRTS